MKTPSLLIAGFLIVLVNLADASQHRRGRRCWRRTGMLAAKRNTRRRLRRRALRRGRARLPSRSSTGRLDGLDGNGRACADCHMATDHFQLSPADVEARFQRLQLPAPAASRRRRSAVPADRRGRFPDQRRQRQRFQQPSPERSRQDHLRAAAEYQAHRSRDQRAVGRDVRGRVAERADGQRRRPHRAGRCQSVAARSERVRRIPAGRAVTTLQEQALGALTNHAQVQQAPPQQLLDDLSVVSARAVHEPSRSRAGRCHQRRARCRCRIPIRRSTSSSSRARPCSSAPAASATAVRDSRRRRRRSMRFHDIFDASVRGPSTPRRPRASRLRRVRRNSRAMRGPTRSPWPTARKIRRTSSDPGRALLTGSSAAPAPRTTGTSSTCPALRGISKTAPYFHNNSAATLEEVVDHYIEFFKRVQINAAQRRAAGRVDRRRALRSAADAGGARGAAGVSAEALSWRPFYTRIKIKLRRGELRGELREALRDSCVAESKFPLYAVQNCSSAA